LVGAKNALINAVNNLGCFFRDVPLCVGQRFRAVVEVIR
jgi:hypothetical protein